MTTESDRGLGGEGDLRQRTLIIGGKTNKELLAELDRLPFIRVDDGARSMIESPNFETFPTPREINFVHVPRIKYGSVDSSGFKLLPAEAALHYLFQHGSELLEGEVFFVGMKPMQHAQRDSDIFRVARNRSGLFLGSNRYNISYMLGDKMIIGI